MASARPQERRDKRKELTSPGNSTRCFKAGSGSNALRLISSKRSGRPRKNLWCENSQVCASVEVRCARGVWVTNSLTTEEEGGGGGEDVYPIYLVEAVHVELAYET